MRVYPSYVTGGVPERVEAVDLGDPVSHVRLKLPGPVPRLTLVWENR
jgi:hypothetical protein